MVLLGVNIDHVATVRNARGGAEPDPILAALIAEEYGADGITAHLREDRRHIRDEDIYQLKWRIKTRLNLEMAATPEMVNIALDVRPYMVTLVPERREELTTEGGLDVIRVKESLKESISKLSQAGIIVSLFVDPDRAQLDASKEVGAPVVELHTGEYANKYLKSPAHAKQPLLQLMEAARYCGEIGLEVNAGHGLTYENVGPILEMSGLIELNIGHNIIAKAIFTGIGPAVQDMKRILSSVPSSRG
jgi:pyridoxine 5-phosphate synthase